MKRIALTTATGLLFAAFAIPAFASGGHHDTTRGGSFTVYEVSERISLVNNDTQELGPPAGPDDDATPGPQVGDVIVLESGIFADAEYRSTTDLPMLFPGAPLWEFGTPWETFDPVGDRIGELLGDCRFVRAHDERERVTVPLPSPPAPVDEMEFVEPDTDAEDRLGTCVLTLSLPDGDIVASGVLDITQLEAAEPAELAITGGTGRYRKAVGTFTLEQPSLHAFDRFRIDVDYRSHRQH